jgi:predicted dehydrogenase
LDKIRVGLVGCGEATQIMHLHSLNQLADYFEITALCDVSQHVMDTLGNRWNIKKRFLNERELLEQDDVDAILIATPNQFHARTTIRAANNGKHVIVEKPMCFTFREADEIVAAQQKSGVTVQVAYMRRYADAFLQACDMVRTMGEIHMARVHDVIGYNSLIIGKTSNVIRGKDISEQVVAESRQLEDALFSEALGDSSSELRRTYGMLLGLASHDVSAMREMLGMPRKVLYAAARRGGSYITAALDYGDYICHIEIGVDAIPIFDAYLRVYGQDKVIQVQYDTPYVRNLQTRLLVTETTDGQNTVDRQVNPAWGDNFTLEWLAFYENITQKKMPKTSPQDFRDDLKLFADMIELIR